MGNNSSSAEANGAEKALGDEIVQAIISELHTTMSISKTAIGKEKSTYEKKIREMLILQEKFQDYLLQLQNSLEENKQKIVKIDKEKQDSKDNLYKKLLDQEQIVSDLKEKYKKTKKILDSERDIRMSLEKNVMEMKTLKMDIQAQTKKTEELQRDIESTRDKLLEQIKLNIQLETKLKLVNNSTSTDETTNVLRDTITKQIAINKQVTEDLDNTQNKLEQELRNKQENSIKYAMTQQLCAHLKTEKEHLINRVLTLQSEHAAKISQNKVNLEQIQELTEKLTATQKINRLQVKLKKKAQADVSLLEEKNRTIKQLETELQEKDKIITENLKQTKKKSELDNNFDTETVNFMKMSEEARVKELKMKDLELTKTKSNYESKLQAQSNRINRLVYRLKMTEKGRDRFEQCCKNAEGKLNLLLICHTDIKKFCEVELKDRKKFLDEFEKFKQKSNEDFSQSFLNEKMFLEAQLEGNTNEISLLKQQLKSKETEIQNITREENSDNKKKEIPATSKEIEAIQQEKMVFETQLDGKTKEIELLKGQLKLKEIEIQSIARGGPSENKETEITSISSENVLQTELDSKTKEIAALKSQLKLKETKIQNMVREEYSENKKKEIPAASSEIISLQKQLDNQTNEIASLKQQLKLKATEIQNMACEEQSEIRKMEMAKLHDEFEETLKKFNQ